jgi:hypothetical protein
VSDTGVVVGAAGSQAFRWTSSGGLTLLGGEPATDISADGNVVVGMSGVWRTSDSQWRLLEGPRPVNWGDPCPGPLTQANAVLAVSANGSRAVGAFDNVSGQPEWRWNPSFWSTSTREVSTLSIGDCQEPYFQHGADQSMSMSASGRFVGGRSFGTHITLSCGGGIVWDTQLGTHTQYSFNFRGRLGAVQAISANGGVIAGVQKSGESQAELACPECYFQTNAGRIRQGRR